MTTETTIMMLLIIVIAPVTGIILALTPYFVKKSEVFAVSVPEASAPTPTSSSSNDSMPLSCLS